MKNLVIFVFAFVLASPVLAGTAVVNNGDGTANFTLTNVNLFAFLDLCTARGYLDDVCQQVDVDFDPTSCQAVGDPLPTTECTAEMVAANACRAEAQGQQVPVFANCADFLGGRAQVSLRTEVAVGRARLAEEAAADPGDPDVFGDDDP